jgi:hypothetical protein
VAGFDISIENREGTIRRNKDPRGPKWQVKMPAHYGYIKRTEGADGDQIDVYVAKGTRTGPGTVPPNDVVVVINQKDLKTGKFDEHKAMLGFANEGQAVETYIKGFSDGRGAERIESVATMTHAEFREWIKTANLKKPAESEEQAAARELAKSVPPPTVVDPLPTGAMVRAKDLLRGETRTVIKNHLTGQTTEGYEYRLADLLKRIDTKNLGRLQSVMLPFIRQKLAMQVGHIPVYVVDREGMSTMVEGSLTRQGKKPESPAGVWQSAYQHILLKDTVLADPARAAHVVIHEGLHAAFQGTIDRHQPIRIVIRGMMNLVNTHLDAREREVGGRIGAYGLTNEHEFISEAFSNPEFQELLSQVRLPQEIKRQFGLSGNIRSAWDWLVSQVRRALALPPGTHTVLDAAMRMGEILERQIKVDFDRDLEAIRQGQQIDPLILPSFKKEAIVGVSKDQRIGAALRTHKLVLRGSTLDQIRQTYRNVFSSGAVDHLERIVANVQKITPYASSLRETGERFANQAYELARTNRLVANEAAELRNDITMAKVNVIDNGAWTPALLSAANAHLGKDSMQSWQAKAHLEDLQKRFMKLPSDVREQMLEEGAHYRQVQTNTARALAENWVRELTHLTPAQRRDIVTKTLAGTLGESDKKLIDNNTVFNTLESASELKPTQGLYYPLQRHGDYVVRTRDEIKDLMGGKEIEPGIVEFRFSNDKDARAAVKNFAEKSELTVTGKIKKRYYDGTTGAQLTAADANVLTTPVDHVYLVPVQKEGVHFFDTASEAAKFIREEGKDYSHVSPEPELRQDVEARGDLGSSQLSSLLKSIEQRTDLSSGHRELLKVAIRQGALRLMSGNRVQKKSLPRRNVAGASTDYARNALSYATASSSYLAKLKYMPDVNEDMGKIEEIIKKSRFDKGNQTRNLLFEELKHRIHENVTDYKQPSKLMGDVLTLSFLSKLFGLGHNIINATQTIMVTYPVLAGQHGSLKALLEIQKAYRDIGALKTVGQGIVNTATAVAQFHRGALGVFDTVDAIRKRFASDKDLIDVIDFMKERGALNDTAEFEIARPIAEGRGAFGTTLAKVDRVARQLPTAIENINRTVSGVAAYRLGKSSGMDHETARQYAFDTVMKTQGDYSPVNAPPIFNHPLARPALQFKKYAQMMTHLWGQMAYTAFKGATRAERRVALKQFANLAGMQIAMAGALSLPGLEIAKAFIMVAAALGFGSGYDDLERKLRRASEEAVGKTLSDMVLKGVLSRAVGIDLSTRLSLSDSWLFGEPENYTKAGVASYIGKQAIGAPGSMGLDFLDSMKAAGEGDWKTAVIKGFPVKFIDDMAKGVKGYEKGEMSALEAGVLGVTSLKTAGLAERQEKRGGEIKAREALRNEGKKLRNQYLDATTRGEKARLTGKIREYNAKVGYRDRIYPKSLEQVKSKNEARRREIQG